MEVRLARLEDAEATRLIYNAEVTGSTVTFDLEPRTLDDQRAWIARHQGPHPAVVAVADGAVAGFGSLSPFRERPAYATTVEDSVYVGADWRGRGVGRALLDELVARSEAAGVWTLQAGVFPENEASMALHRSCGFRIVGVRERLGEVNGVWRDVVMLERRSGTVG